MWDVDYLTRHNHTLCQGQMTVIVSDWLIVTGSDSVNEVGREMDRWPADSE